MIMTLQKNNNNRDKKCLATLHSKIIKPFITLLLVILIVFVFAGCWDSLDVNEKSMLISVGIDRKGEEYIFYAEVANLTSEEDSTADKFTLTKSVGNSYIDVRSQEDIKFDRVQFLGATEILFLTVDLTKSGMEDYMYRLRRLSDYRRTLGIVTTFEKVEDLFNVELARQVSLGETIDGMMETLVGNGQAIQNNTSEILEYFSSDNACFLLPNINIKENQTALTGYSVIEKGYFQGYIPIEKTKGLLCFLNDEARLQYNVPFEDKIAIVEVNLKERIIEPLYNGKTIDFNTRFKFESKVRYLNMNEGLDENAIKKVTQNLESMLIKDIYYAFSQSQNIYKADYLGFYNAFRISFPNEIKEMDWYKEYLSTKINLTVETSLDPGGMLDYDPPKN